MNRIIRIEDVADERVAVYSSLTERELRTLDSSDAEGSEQGRGVFIAESPKVIRVAIQAGYRPLSMLCEERHISGDAAGIISACPGMDVFTGSREVLSALTGYTLTRGVLCAMRRPAPLTPEQVCRGVRRVAVIDDVTDTTNIGAIFRSAAALGIDGILLSATACDPLNRRAVRVSMGSVFLIPWAYLDAPARGTTYLGQLRELGLTSVALALRDDSVAIDDEELQRCPCLAIIMGTEGEGLPDAVIAGADYVARIPMARGVDSLNVAAASAVAFWQLRSASC